MISDNKDLTNVPQSFALDEKRLFAFGMDFNNRIKLEI